MSTIEETKAKAKVYRVAYREAHKDALQAKEKAYRDANKAKRKVYYQEVVQCECGHSHKRQAAQFTAHRVAHAEWLESKTDDEVEKRAIANAFGNHDLQRLLRRQIANKKHRDKLAAADHL